jgi:PII-like signaling protein
VNGGLDLEGERSMLRVYLLDGDRFGRRPLADYLLEEARKAGLAGATVLRGTSGFGRHGFETILDVLEFRPQFQPVVIEMVDRRDRLEAFLRSSWTEDLPDRMVTLERAQVELYQARTS